MKSLTVLSICASIALISFLVSVITEKNLDVVDFKNWKNPVQLFHSIAEAGKILSIGFGAIYLLTINMFRDDSMCINPGCVGE